MLIEFTMQDLGLLGNFHISWATFFQFHFPLRGEAGSIRQVTEARVNKGGAIRLAQDQLVQ